MDIGIIIIFNNNALDIDKSLQEGLTYLRGYTQLCLVNNGSTDKTLKKLHELNDVLGAVCSILDIKQNKGIEVAIKAGARFCLTQNNLKYIGFIDVSEVNAMPYLYQFISNYKNNKNLIAHYNLNIEKSNRMKRTLFKNTFSIIECLSRQHLFINKLIL